MSNVNNLSTIVSSALTELAELYETNGTLPNLAKTEDGLSFMVSMGNVALNFTMAFNVVADEDLGHYFQITAYFAQEDFIYPEGATRENALFIVRAAPYYKIFSDSFTASGDTLEEAAIDAIYVVINEIEKIISLLSEEMPE